MIRLRTLAFGAGLVEYDKHVREVTPNWSPEIKAYLADTGIRVPAPWCAALQQYITDRGAHLHGLENPLDAVKQEALVQSYVDWAKANDKIIPPEQADVGDLIAFNFYHKTFDHIGMCASRMSDVEWIRSLEGNTNDDGSRDGNGIYKNWRHFVQQYTVIIRWDNDITFDGTVNQEIADALFKAGYSANT